MAAVASVRGGPRVSSSQIFNGAVGLLVVAALVVQSVLIVRSGTVPMATRFVRMFSFFTVQSNILVAIAAFTLVLAPARDGRWWRVLRLDALVGISVTGVVYTTVLRAEQQLHGWAVATDAVFHYAVPLATVIGWLAFGPRPRCDARTACWSLAWPVTWLAYTLLHGQATGWYPYPFIDVTRHGYGLVVLNAIAVSAALAVMAAAFWLGDAYLPGGRPRRPARSLPAGPSVAGFAAAPAIADEQVKQPPDDADDDGAPEGRPEPGDVERQGQLAGYPAGEPEQQPVDHEADQPQGKHVEETADDLGDRLQHRVHDAEDQGYHDERGDLRQGGGGQQLDAGNDSGRDE